MKEWHFFDKVYRRWVWLQVGPFEEFKASLDDVGFKFMDELRDGLGMTVKLSPDSTTTRQNLYVVWLSSWNISTLVHEITHLVLYIFDELGVPTGIENTEGIVFYTEYWFNEIQRTRKRLPNGRTPAQARRE